MRILHGEESYEYLATIYPGDTLVGVTTITDGKTRRSQNGSMDIITLQTRYTNQDNQPVLNATTMFVVRK
jgi:acyl dehydratase